VLGVEKLRFVYFQEDDMLVGYLEDYPDYMTQGVDLEELKENLKDIYDDIVSGKVEKVKKYGELVVG
jgi:predicted RNase H-like HicB family nuclease